MKSSSSSSSPEQVQFHLSILGKLRINVGEETLISKIEEAGAGSSSSSSKQLTFSKRKNGLLRKAKELVAHCDAELGVVVFSCTGQLYEYASPSMKEVIERYNNQKGENHHQQQLPATDIKLLEEEVASLKLQVQNLEASKRQLMGETSGLSLKDLQFLENQLEMSLSTVRVRKDQIRIDQIKDLHIKRNRVHQENAELKEKVNCLINKEKVELIDKRYYEGDSSEANNRCQSSYDFSHQYDLNVPAQYFHPQQLLPFPDDGQMRAVETELDWGLRFDQQNESRDVDGD